MIVSNPQTIPTTLLAILLTTTFALSQERVIEPPFIMILPPTFNPPTESVSVSGSTYTYLSAEKGRGTGLTATILKKSIVHQQTGALDSNQCAKIFLDELGTKHERFFTSIMVRPINVGETQFPQFRWSGEKNGVPLTGVLTCALIEGRYLIFNLTDRLETAAQNFPAIRKSIQNITFR